MLRFACPRCKFALSAPDNRGGTKTHCPKCQQRLRVPMPPTNKTVLAPLMEHRPTTLHGSGQSSVWLKPALATGAAVAIVVAGIIFASGLLPPHSSPGNGSQQPVSARGVNDQAATEKQRLPATEVKQEAQKVAKGPKRDNFLIDVPLPDQRRVTEPVEGDILQLMDAGVIRSQILAVTINKVQVRVELRNDQETTLTVPAGLLFRSKNTTYQDLVVVENLKTSIGPENKQATLEIITCCTNRKRKPPVNLDYAIQRLPENDKIRERAEGLAISTMGIDQKQWQMWMFTDKLDNNRWP